MRDSELQTDTSTPMASTMIKLLGGESYGRVTLSTTEQANLRRLYDIQATPPGPAQALFEAAAVRSMFREAEVDGLLVMAVLAQHLEKGENPVKFLVRLLAESDVDHPDDTDWAYEEEDDDHD